MAMARVLWCARSIQCRGIWHEIVERVPYLGRIGHTSRIGQANGLEADINQARDDGCQILQRHCNFKGQPNEHEMPPAAAHRPHAHARHGCELGERFRHGHVDVGQVVTLTR